MIERYPLDGPTLPTIPCPHDFVITGIEESEDSFTFRFEEDISYHDAARAIHPEARGLTTRFEKLRNGRVYQDETTIQWFRFERRHYESGYLLRKHKALFQLPKREEVTYLAHYVARFSIVIELG